MVDSDMANVIPTYRDTYHPYQLGDQAILSTKPETSVSKTHSVITTAGVVHARGHNRYNTAQSLSIYINIIHDGFDFYIQLHITIVHWDKGCIVSVSSTAVP